MNTQLYSILSLKCADGPLQTVRNMLNTKDDNIKGIKTWCKILLSMKGQNANRSQMLTERVHNVKQVKHYGDIMQAIERHETAMKEHERDTNILVADITKANCLRKMVPDELATDIKKMSHLKTYQDIKEYILQQVQLHAHDKPKSRTPKDGDVNHVENGGSEVQEDICEPCGDELFYMKGKAKGKGRNCFHCGEPGHMQWQCPTKDKEMAARRETKGGGKSYEAWPNKGKSMGKRF